MRNLLIMWVLIVSAFFAGYWLKGHNSKPVYVKGDTVYVKTDTFTLVAETTPKYVVLPQRIDTIFGISDTVYVNKGVDSAKVVSDYCMLRTYSKELFNSGTLGQMNVFAEVQYNKLSSMSYEFTPIIRDKEPPNKLNPFVFCSASLVGDVSVNAGLLKSQYGLSIGLSRYGERTSLSVGFLKKW